MVVLYKCSEQGGGGERYPEAIAVCGTRCHDR